MRHANRLRLAPYNHMKSAKLTTGTHLLSLQPYLPNTHILTAIKKAPEGAFFNS